jgi:hypothetical protein
VKCICKENHWNDFFVGNSYYYKDEISIGGYRIFIVNNNKRNYHSFSLEVFNTHFMTENEERKLKLEKINERQVNL